MMIGTFDVQTAPFVLNGYAMKCHRSGVEKFTNVITTCAKYVEHLLALIRSTHAHSAITRYRRIATEILFRRICRHYVFDVT
jgi:hypothetical protein